MINWFLYGGNIRFSRIFKRCVTEFLHNTFIIGQAAEIWRLIDSVWSGDLWVNGDFGVSSFVNRAKLEK